MDVGELIKNKLHELEKLYIVDVDYDNLYVKWDLTYTIEKHQFFVKFLPLNGGFLANFVYVVENTVTLEHGVNTNFSIYFPFKEVDRIIDIIEFIFPLKRK